MRYRTSIGIEALYVGIGPGMALLLSLNMDSWVLVGVAVCNVGVLVWMVTFTRYVIEDGVVDVRMGGLHRRIRIRLDEITAVQCGHRWKSPTRGFGSDFVCIEYRDQAVNVSPRDLDGFLAALGHGEVPADPPSPPGRSRPGIRSGHEASPAPGVSEVADPG